MTRLLVLQSNYLPWKGYFDLIATVDQMILYDTAQFTERDWRNRNRIKTPSGLKWLTVPVVRSGRFGQAIEAVEITGGAWARRHLALIEMSYAKAPYYQALLELIEPALTAGHTKLSQLNRDLIDRICSALSISTPIAWSRDFAHDGDATQKLVDLCLATGATELVCGASAKSYLDVCRLADVGTQVIWFEYTGYPPYPQRHGPFDHHVSIIDLLAETGPEARCFMHCGAHECV